MRTAILCLFLMLIGCVLAGTAQADVPPFDRYQVILDRKPFGEPPPITEPEPELTTVDPTKSFARAMRLSMIVKDDDGTIKVGIVDQTTKSSITLRVGEEDPGMGIELVSADYEAEEAVLRKDQEMAVVKLNAGVIVPVAAPPKIDPNRRSPSRLPSRSTHSSHSPQPPQPPAAEPVKPRYTGEELRKHLQDYNVEVIRQGLPPLPIQLSKEQDEQLVKEGVLPPQAPGTH